MKEKLGKEKEALQTELISLKDRLRESNTAAEEAKRKLTNAESQLVDLTSQGLDTTDVSFSFFELWNFSFGKCRAGMVNIFLGLRDILWGL